VLIMVKKEAPAPKQTDFDKSFEDMKAGKIPGPTNDDSGPLPSPEPKKETVKPVKKMAKGGTASSRADGCCVRGKTRA